LGAGDFPRDLKIAPEIFFKTARTFHLHVASLPRQAVTAIESTFGKADVPTLKPSKY
jgi:hypothetical protein